MYQEKNEVIGIAPKDNEKPVNFSKCNTGAPCNASV